MQKAKMLIVWWLNGQTKNGLYTDENAKNFFFVLYQVIYKEWQLK